MDFVTFFDNRKRKNPMSVCSLKEWLCELTNRT